MSDPVVFNRRDFLKLVGIGVAGTAAGCRQPAERVIPYLVGPNDQLPGVATYYASTCAECPAGCGVLVKTREGRAIKIEGNPDHPLGQSGLCTRGQAALQGLYDPDRVRSPLLKRKGQWEAVSWDDALELVGSKLRDARRGKHGIAMLSGHDTGSLARLEQEFADAFGVRRLVYEPFAYESLREGNRRTFGVAAVPAYDFGSARMIVSFGADFLETFVSPVSQAGGFAAMRADLEHGHFVAVEPRLSLTGANADEWVAIRPGTEAALALGMARVILSENLATHGGSDLMSAVSAYTPDEVEKQTDVPAAQVQKLARRFAGARPSLAVAGGIATQSEQSTSLVAAVNLLNWVCGNVGRTVRFDRTLDFDGISSFTELQDLIHAMGAEEVDVMFVRGTNPVYSVPPWAGFAAAFHHVAFKVAFAASLDETADACDLVLPASHPLESLGDALTARGVYSLIQPSMRKLPMFDSRPAGESLLALMRAAGNAGAAADWRTYVKDRWRDLHRRFGAGRTFDVFWEQSLQKGGVWEDVSPLPVRWTGAPSIAPPALKGAGDLALVLYPSSALYDGRGANKPWLQELPDVTTKAVWATWVEIHPDTAATIGVAEGDPVAIETESGKLELPAYLYRGVRPDTIAVPLGQGHTAYGRYATGIGANALSLLPPAQDVASGAVAYLSTRAHASRGIGKGGLVTTQHSRSQHDRRIAQVIPLAALTGAAAAGGEGGEHEGHETPQPWQVRPGTETTPLEPQVRGKLPTQAITAYEAEDSTRGPRAIPVTQGSYKNATHRWAMAIDLNACTGCSACVVACYAENNIPVVGPELVKRGREMEWIRIERFDENLKGPGAPDVRHIPMLCQQCGNAPCEIVCPVYATYHTPEGLNAQVYNRCVGTRYCSNNCPYKVRVFNWFEYGLPGKPTYAFPEPLNWQLNPDVTVRSKGVMEKCTMCIQRILEVKGNAKDERRKVRDGELKTACSQGCPTQAIVVGDLADPESAVSKASHGPRRYWVFNELNTKPGLTYLKRITRTSEEHA